MARAYQEAHIIDSLNASVKELQTKTADLAKAKGYHEEKLKNLTTAHAELQRKYDALEIRLKANEHNTTARLQNTHLSLPLSSKTNNNTPLTPLHDLVTNRPIRHLPRHPRDIRTLSSADVVQCLQALDVSSLGLSNGEKKARLREEIGLVAAEVGGGEKKKKTKEEEGEEEGGGDGGKGKGTKTPADNSARTKTENAKKAAEVRRKVLEAKARKMEGGKEAGKK